MALIMTANGQIGHGGGSVIQGGAFVVTSAPSTKVTVGGSGVYRGVLQYTFSGGSAAGFDPGTIATTAPQVINGTATKVTVDGQAPVLHGDVGVMAAQGTVSGVPSSVSGPVEVVNAGQTKVSAI